MADFTLATATGGETVIGQGAVDELAASLQGDLLIADSPGYDEARALWNGMIDKRPGLIARCATANDVVRAVKFARDEGLLIAIRGAGHNIAGNAVCDDGLVIDLSQMKSVEVDEAGRTARVGPGATLGDFDQAVQAHGLATPTGINSTTGIAGLTLGGGFGWLSRKHGLTIDNLISADVVLASGELVKASETENADLFWGIRGGGGNFGIVTAFEFKLHELGPEVLAGLIVHPFKDASKVLRGYREFVSGAPDELTCWVILRKAPPLPFLPEEVHGTEVLVLAVLYAGDIEEGKRALKDLRGLGDPIADAVAPHNYAEFQAAFDPLLTPGARNYWKSHDFTELSDAAIDVFIEYAGKLPTPQCELFLAQLGGAVGRVAPDATAYTHRDAEFVLNVHARWEDPAQDGECLAWAREVFNKTAPFATGGVYVNFMPNDEMDRVAAAYGVNYERLVELKDKYDPGNMFRLNQNIRPSVSA